MDSIDQCLSWLRWWHEATTDLIAYDFVPWGFQRRLNEEPHFSDL